MTEDWPQSAEIVDRLAAVDGVVGVVLGGSRARGTNSPASDYDFGVYYEADRLDLSALGRVARELDDEHRSDLIAPPGGWGNWVNGGGWLVVDGRPVDIILRDIARVELAVADCQAGRVHMHYQTGHPHAYVNVMYAGELAIAKNLRDDSGRLRELQAKTVPYPPETKKALIHFFGFEAGFSLMLARASADGRDDFYVMAHIARALACLNQVLFAVNEEYCINEKNAVRMIDSFPVKPENYGARVTQIVSQTGAATASACHGLEALLCETRTFYT